jgi:TRAP-type C4-dicarboxylate transport system substrate-binding protein
MRIQTIIAAASVAMFAAITSSQATTTFNYSSWLPWTHPVNTHIYLKWMSEVEKRSEGRIKFRHLPKAVAHPRAHLDAVRTSQAHAGMSVHGYSPKRFAAYMFAEHPFLGDRATASSVALARTHAKFFAGKNLYKGVHLVGMNTHGPGVIHHSKKVFTVPSDMKGQKMRTGGPIPKRIVEAWGGVAVRQPASKSYEVLSTGIVDGITFPYESLDSFKITKLVPYSTYVPGGLYSSSHYLVISKKKYDGLSSSDKKMINGLSGEKFAHLAGRGWDTINDAGLAGAKKAGNKMTIAPAAIINAVKKLNAEFSKEYIASVKAAGIDGAAVLKYFKGEVAKLQGK